MQAIGIAKDQNILRAGMQAATASRAKAATANAAAAAVATPTASMQEQLDKHLAEVKVMLVAQKGAGSAARNGRSGTATASSPTAPQPTCTPSAQSVGSTIRGARL
eukprot:742367-Rhodomonas_salina.1